MNREANKLEIERSAEINANRPSEMVRDPRTGRVFGVPAEKAETSARRRGYLANLRGGVYFLPMEREETDEERKKREEREARYDKMRDDDRAWEADYDRRKAAEHR
jgi:hypothetical protein